MFSGHDSSITKVLESIDLTEHIAFPKYAASVVFEVYQTGKKYEVKIMYRSDNYQQEPNALKLKGSEQIHWDILMTSFVNPSRHFSLRRSLPDQ